MAFHRINPITGKYKQETEKYSELSRFTKFHIVRVFEDYYVVQSFDKSSRDRKPDIIWSNKKTECRLKVIKVGDGVYRYKYKPMGHMIETIKNLSKQEAIVVLDLENDTVRSFASAHINSFLFRDLWENGNGSIKTFRDALYDYVWGGKSEGGSKDNGSETRKIQPMQCINPLNGDFLSSKKNETKL